MWLDGLKKKKTQLYVTYRRLFSSEDTQRLRVKGWMMTFQVNGNPKKIGIAILISDKIDFKSKSVRRDKVTV